MIVSLDPVSEDSELNLAHASAVPIVMESAKFQLGEKFTYQYSQ